MYKEKMKTINSDQFQIHYIVQLSNISITTQGKMAAQASSNSHVTSDASSVQVKLVEGTFSAMSSRHHNIIQLGRSICTLQQVTYITGEAWTVEISGVHVNLQILGALSGVSLGVKHKGGKQRDVTILSLKPLQSLTTSYISIIHGQTTKANYTASKRHHQKTKKTTNWSFLC